MVSGINPNSAYSAWSQYISASSVSQSQSEGEEVILESSEESGTVAAAPPPPPPPVERSAALGTADDSEESDSDELLSMISGSTLLTTSESETEESVEQLLPPMEAAAAEGSGLFANTLSGSDANADAFNRMVSAYAQNSGGSPVSDLGALLFNRDNVTATVAGQVNLGISSEG